MLKQIRSCVVACVVASVAGGVLAPARLDAQNIVPSGPPIGAFTGLGTGWYLDVGQSFVAGGAYLTSFSFWLGPAFAQNFTPGVGDPTSGVEFIPYVMAWDGTNVVGSALFQGAAVDVQGLTSYQEYDFSTGSLSLSPGAVYVAVLQAVNDGTHTGNVKVGSGFTGSGAVADNKQGQSVKPLTDDWAITNAGLSTTFAASFSNTPVTATPEPATLMLLATGMAGVFGTSRFRRPRRDRADA